MGIGNMLMRNLKNRLRDTRRSISKWMRRATEKDKEEPVEVPRSWRKKEKKPSSSRLEKPPGYQKHRIRIPHLLTFKRALAGILLLLNFSLSQFLLGSVGAGGQGMFILFLLNCFIFVDYLWKTRRKED